MSAASQEDLRRNWYLTKDYLIRSLFQDTTALSPIYEESASSNLERNSVVSPCDSGRADSPLPPLIIEKEPNKHDDPPEYYQQLYVRMLEVYKQLFGGDGWMDCSSSPEQQHDISAEPPVESPNATISSDLDQEPEDIETEEPVESSVEDHNTTLTSNLDQESEDIDTEEITDVEKEEGDTESSNGSEVVIDENNEKAEIVSVEIHREDSTMSPNHRSPRSEVTLEKNTDPESNISNVSITKREIEFMRSVTERQHSFGLLQALSSSSDAIAEPICISPQPMDETSRELSRKRQSDHLVTSTPVKVTKYADEGTQTCFEDTWDSYFRCNLFAGTPKLFKLCSCRNLCDC